MLTARPLDVFRIGEKCVVACKLEDENPMEFLNREFAFYGHGILMGYIRINGVSTASDPNNQVYDFSYSGDEILPEQLCENSFIVERSM